MFVCAGVLFLVAPLEEALHVSSPLLWIFAIIVLFGCIAASLRNITLAKLVTLLVPMEKRANANGLVGTVSDIGFIITSVFSGLAIGLLGMGWTLVIAIGLMIVVLIDVLRIRIPEAAHTKKSKWFFMH